MDAVLDWLKDPLEETQQQHVGNSVRAWHSRELGIEPKNYPANKNVLENYAEDTLVQKPLKIRCCDLPGYPRSTFLMVFSPDGTKVASTHGNHNVYVSELASGKHVRILKGHPRTPWCIAFHPSHTQLIGSGCLGGEVRVWDITSGGSEVWNVRSETVIASIAFHPREQLLVIATYNELYFWDWSQPAPYMRVCTNNINEKVRYVAFDALGYKLITGISLWASATTAGGSTLLQQNPNLAQMFANRREDDERNQENGSAQDMIVNSYQNLVQRYDSLVRNYQRLFMVRHRLTSTTPPPTIDRGTDPMEPDAWLGTSSWSRDRTPQPTQHDDGNPGPSTSQGPEGAVTADVDGESSSSRLLNFDVLSIDGDATERNSDPPFGSRSSAFQPLSEGRSFRTVDQSERSTRLLPNPFSASGSGRPRNTSDAADNSANTSRTSIFMSFRPETTFGQSFLERSQSHAQNITRTLNASVASENSPFSRFTRSEVGTSTSQGSGGTSRPTMTNTATQMSPSSASVDAQTINESLDLIRDILRDSGTRLLNLITNMSISTLTSVERTLPRRGGGRTQSDDSEGGGRTRGTRTRGTRPRMRLLSPRRLRQDLLSSSSDSDSSDQSLEINIFRTRNVTTDNDAAAAYPTQTATAPVQIDPNGRMTFEPEDPMTETVPDFQVTVENQIRRIRVPNESNNEESGTTSRNEVVEMSSANEEPETSPTNDEPVTSTSSINGEAQPSSRDAELRALIGNQESVPSSRDAELRALIGNEVSAPSSRNAELRALIGNQESVPSSRNAELRALIGNEVSAPSSRNAELRALIGIEESVPSSRNAELRELIGNHESVPSSRDAELRALIGNEESVPSSRDAELRALIGNEVSTPLSRDAELRALIGNGESGSAGPETRDDTNQSENASPRPSTSRDNFWDGGRTIPPAEAYKKVKTGVAALQKHTSQLSTLWLRGNRPTMRELRTMWENLRRRVLALHRETGRQDLPSHYTRSLLERCMMLTDIGDHLPRATPIRPARNRGEERNSDRNAADNRNASTSTEPANTDNGDRNENASAENTGDNRPSTSGRSPQPRGTGTRRRSSPTLRRILRSSHRWRVHDELRRRLRNPSTHRVTEISATRHEIRMRAMQVLSVMFNMMMMCLEERGLSHLIITMLKTLKKALALTCLMLMMIRNGSSRSNNPAPSTPQRVGSLSVVRIQNDEHSGPVNVDGPDDPAPAAAVATAAADASPETNELDSQPARKKTKTEKVETQSQSTSTDFPENVPSTSSQTPSPQKWSNRVAVQIAAANRNNSVTARDRRELYLESRRQKALHKTNPGANPIAKKRALPPVSTHRIPALRSLPSKLRKGRQSTPRNQPGMSGDDPAAGPSNRDPEADDQEPRDEVLNEFEHRVNLIRLAHLQAVRLRNAARTRFRRLQTIRLYSPSSVREMFSAQNNNGGSASENPAPAQNGNNQEGQLGNHSNSGNPDNPGNSSNSGNSGNRRTFSNFAMYRPHILTRNEAGNRPNEEPAHFHAVLNNVAMPLMQVNELPANAEGNGIQPNRLPRIHEYLQPIILAQNAMVVDDENVENGGGINGEPTMRRRMAGMAGLLDAGIVPEALPTPSHRVQAWDFTTGQTPEIANNAKNVVVQRCRIHNDASIDISKDGRLLVALLPVPRLRNTNHWLGVYSLEWARLGQCLHTAVLEQSAVSVALSPTARHLAVGLGSRRFTTTPHARNNVFALLYRLEPLESTSRTGLSPIKELEQNWEHGFTSLNCLRWAPQPGQGLVYANNTGQLIVMS